MEFNNNKVIKLQMNSNSQVPINSTKSSIVVGAAAAVAMNASSTDTTPKAKMGSRRIFKTEFKVQVLDSYWNDNDCKGNQRATARKYGIHRRQIQKWLGNEKSLREQLKNQNTNNVVKPHQFHNVAYGNVAAAAVVAASAVKVSSTSPQTASKLMSLGQARHCVAPTSTTSLSPSSTSSSSSLSLSPSAVGTNTSTAITPIRPIPHQHPHTPVTIVPPTHFTQQHYHYHHSQLPHFMPPSTSLPTTSTTDEYSLMVAGNHHQQQQQHHHQQQQQHNHHHQQQSHFNIHQHYQQQQQQLQIMAPIDLSLQRKPEILEHQPPMKLSLKPINFNDNSEQAPAKSSTSTSAPSVLAVDLTCRKRQNQSVADEDCTPEKVQKIKEENADDDDEEVDVDVEVDDGIEVQVAKPIKLFKPYLLDEEEENKDSEPPQQDPIIWSHSLTPNNRTCSSRSTTDSGCYPFPSGSPIFPSSPSSLGAFSPAAACPKGSPVSVSGYESSSSTSTFGEYPTYNYSIDFKVNNYPTARSDNHSHVQRWLDHDANLRQGIAY